MNFNYFLSVLKPVFSTPAQLKQKIIPTKGAYIQYISNATLVRYLAFSGTVPFLFPCRVICGGFLTEDKQKQKNWFLFMQCARYEKVEKCIYILSSHCQLNKINVSQSAHCTRLSTIFVGPVQEGNIFYYTLLQILLLVTCYLMSLFFLLYLNFLNIYYLHCSAWPAIWFEYLRN